MIYLLNCGALCVLRLANDCAACVATVCSCVALFAMCAQATPAAARPLVKVYDGASGATTASVPLPAVFTAPIRRDIVQFVHTNMAKNKCVLAALPCFRYFNFNYIHILPRS
jgi:hypothetical protein